MSRVNGTQLRIPGLSLKVTGRRRKAPSVASFKLPPLLSTKFEVDIDDELLVTLQGADGEVIASHYVQCDAVSFRKHRPNQGPAWLERIHTLGESDSNGNGDEHDPNQEGDRA